MRDTRGGQKEDGSGLTPNNIPLIDNLTTDVQDQCNDVEPLSLNQFLVTQQPGYLWLILDIILPHF